jgi:hypothetical protein
LSFYEVLIFVGMLEIETAERPSVHTTRLLIYTTRPLTKLLFLLPSWSDYNVEQYVGPITGIEIDFFWSTHEYVLLFRQVVGLVVIIVRQEANL